VPEHIIEWSRCFLTARLHRAEASEAMSKQVVVDLPDEIYHRAESLARLTRREVGEVLADAITLSLPSLDDLSAEGRPMAECSDREVVELTRVQLPSAQDKRLSKLLERQQAQRLGEAERIELQGLMQLYQEGLLRKAEALREAVRRGLQGPLEP
jgi:predicted DNA-binding protein